jgi:hypothetical protein
MFSDAVCLFLDAVFYHLEMREFFTGVHKDNNITCNVTSVHDDCPHFDSDINPGDLYEEAKVIPHYMPQNDTKCLIRAERTGVDLLSV